MANPTGPTVIQGDVYVAGNLSASTQSVPANAITDTQVAAGAGISATKSNRFVQPEYAQPNTTATTETKVLHTVRAVGGGTVAEFAVGSIVAAIGAATVTFDLKKNGTSILSGVVTLNSSSTAYVIQIASISTPTVAQGDVLSVVITATASGGTLPTGIFCSLRVNEAAI
jgi:hypothetical protein